MRDARALEKVREPASRPSLSGHTLEGDGAAHTWRGGASAGHELDARRGGWARYCTVGPLLYVRVHGCGMVP